jgi:hypothetical protein
MTKTKRIVGYAHKDTVCRGAFGWYYPIICDRRKFIKLIKGLGKGSEKYWRKITMKIERIASK